MMNQQPSVNEDGCIHVVCGVHALVFLLPTGWTVGQVRQHLAQRMNIDPQADPVIDGKLVEEQTVLAPGMVLMFHRPSGEMG